MRHAFFALALAVALPLFASRVLPPPEAEGMGLVEAGACSSGSRQPSPGDDPEPPPEG